MKYGILCAVRPEIALILEDFKGECVTLAGREFYVGTLYGHEAVLVMCGVGKVASAMTATLLIQHFSVDALLFCGTAGGIDPALRVGDVVIADSLIQHDLFDGDRHFTLPMLPADGRFLPDPFLSAALLQAAERYTKESMTRDIPAAYLEEFRIESPKAVKGLIASGDQFINDPVKSRWLSENLPGLQCAEMEGAAVAQVCADYSLPFAVMRIISDGANSDSSVDFDRFAENAMCHFTRGSLRAFFQSR